ncbi:MAG: hypothetical protein IJX78_06405 [Bacilli bacterium]|nr:hypothetical protein [Bacilli bacterium]
MFIRKKKYNEQLDLIEAYKEKRYKMEKDIYRLRSEKQILEGRVESLEDINNNLIKEQQKLIEWIEKIINEVGCYTVNERNDITIPMYRKDGPAYDTEFNGSDFVVNRDVIVLPRIEILKMG